MRHCNQRSQNPGSEAQWSLAPGVSGRFQRATPDLLRNLRTARVMVFHPKDADGELLAQQLQRIGCQVVTIWPPLADLPNTVDVVFCAVGPDHAALKCNWMRADPVVPVIAIIGYENPTVVEQHRGLPSDTRTGDGKTRGDRGNCPRNYSRGQHFVVRDAAIKDLAGQ